MPARTTKTMYLHQGETVFIEGKHGIIRIDNFSNGQTRIDYDERTDAKRVKE